MAERDGNHVPGWDGSARSWRRYTREVAWFVQSTPTHKRRHCASRLMGRLSGPARLLAMSWPLAAFDHNDGTRKFLQRLASSPLVRRTLPNAAAICQQYFSFKRGIQENINTFLVRETLVHEEFVEAVIRLNEERLGISQENRDFGLPPPEPEEEWWQDEWWLDEEQQPTADSHEEVVGEEQEAVATTDAPLPDGDPRPREPTLRRPGTGSSPSHRGLPEHRGSVALAGGERAESVRPLDELSLADSFIMTVLRGWRLLQAAGLSPEEKRSILSSTKNTLDYDTISQALQTLWDDQLLGHRSTATNYHQSYMSYQEPSYAMVSEDYGDWDYDNDCWWDEHAYYVNNEDEMWWQDDWNEERDTLQAAPAVADDEVDDEKLRDAMKAEKMAEALAAEANRSWTEAQRATAALRRDRGFGAVTSSTATGPCYRCGGNHLMRDCPDRLHPGPHKGGYKGKPSKGKSKSKGKFHAHFAYDDYYFSKGKSKGKVGSGKGKGKEPPRTVNVYAADANHLGGLELHENLAAASEPPTTRPEMGMVDCGATASAGPEAVVRGLISSILTQDKAAQIVLDQASRPYFRFGNGRWGRALFKVNLSSNVSGQCREFSLYALPNPDGYEKEDFDRSTLVPILIGMDYLGQYGMGMLIDFATGLAMCTKDPTPEIFALDTNRKGHYLLDIVHHLTLGHHRDTGHAHVVVLQGHPERETASDNQMLEFNPLQFDMTACDQQFDDAEIAAAKDRMWQLYRHVRRDGCVTAASSVSMGLTPSHRPPPTTSPPCSTGHGAALAAPDLPRRPRTTTPPVRAEDESSPLGSRPRCGNRHSRSPALGGPMAVLRDARAGHSEEQSSRGMDPMLPLQSSATLCASTGISCRNNQDGEPCNGATDVGSAAAADGRCHAQCRHLLGHAEEDRCRRAVGFPDSKADECVSDIEDGGPADTGEQVKREGEADDRDQSSPNNHFRRLAGGRSLERLGNGLPERPRQSTVSPTMRPLPAKVGKKIMGFATMMSMATSSLLLGAHLHDRDGLWEIACAPHSWLSESAQQQGLRPRRINLEAGYDLYHPETWIRLRSLRDQHRPRRLWFSLPCTKWCPWTSVNYNTPELREKLERYRRKERKLMRLSCDFIKETLSEDPEVKIYWEWTWPNAGWKQVPMVQLATWMEQADQAWIDCRVDGCVYGMRDDNGAFLRKQWLIKTNDEMFRRVFGAKVCQGNHGVHGYIQGLETAKSAYYPWKMVQAITRHWRDQLCPNRHHRLLSLKDDLQYAVDEETILGDDELPGGATDTAEDAAGQHQAELHREPSVLLLGDLHDKACLTAEDMSNLPAFKGVSQKEIDDWSVQIHKLHRAAGHPTARNMARIVRDAGHPEWRVIMTQRHHCETCASLKPGGTSSGQIPPSSTHPLYRAWQAVGIDSAEWIVPGQKKKVKFLLFIDMATKLKVAHPLHKLDAMMMKPETAEEVIQALATRWLGCFPKPEVIVTDPGKAFVSERFHCFLSDTNILLHHVADKEHWANGIVESAVKDVKHTSTAIQMEMRDLDPMVTLHLAVSALNSTEYVAGYSSYQWAFGTEYSLTDEDTRTFLALPDQPQQDYVRLITARQKAEEVARKTKAQRTISKLRNSTVRQPLRTFADMDLVKIWRHMWPAEVHKGPRGGFKKSGRPHWIGPGRVVFSEILPQQERGDPRRHIVWVLIGSQLYRCSVHSVRPVSETERFVYETTEQEDPSRWKTLADILPKREYTDIVGEEPDETVQELPDLPPRPDSTTVQVPRRRMSVKTSFRPGEWVDNPVSERLHRQDVNDYDDDTPGHEPGQPSSLPTPPISSTRPGMTSTSSAPATSIKHDPPSVNEYEQPSNKRVKFEDQQRERHGEATWVDQLYVEAAEEAQELDILSAMDETMEFLRIEIDVEPPSSRRQQKLLDRNPCAYLVKKMRDSEVRIANLPPHERELFSRAKLKEVSSFLSNEAVRKCLDQKEIADAYNSQRIVKARWVLTWKLVPPEDKKGAVEDAKTNPNTLHSKGGEKKAKARIVLLGFQHPNLLDRNFKTASPVQSTMGRNLL